MPFPYKRVIDANDSHLLQNLQISRRNGRREARENPLNRHFCTAGSSVKSAEIAQVQRIARSMPPRENCSIALADGGKHSADVAA